MLLTTLLSNCALALPIDVKDAPPQNVLRTYDIVSAAATTGGFREGTKLLPMLGMYPDERTVEQQVEHDTSSVIELLRALNPKEWEYAGRDLTVADDGRLVMRASNALHESTGRFLALLENNFARPVQLVVDVVTLPPLPAGASGASGASGADDAIPGLLPSADIARYVGQARTGGTHTTYTLSLQPGVAGYVHAGRQVQMVTHYAIEVAEGSSVFDPIAQDVSIGTSVVAEVAPSQSGLWLAMIFAEGTALGEVESREMRFQSMITTQDRPGFVSAPRQRQDVRVANRSFVLNSFVPDGKAIAIRSTLELQGGRVTQIVFVHQEGSTGSPYLRLPDELKKAAAATDWLAIDAGSAAPPRAVLARNNWPERTWWLHEPNASTSLEAFVEAANIESIANAIQPQDDMTAVLRTGRWLVLYKDPERAGVAAGDERPAVEDPLVVLGKYTPEARLNQVTLTLKRGDSVLARSSLPVRPGVKSSGMLGNERLALRDFDVEIAKGVSSSQPSVFGIFEGLVYTIEPRVSSSGNLTIDIVADGRVRHGAPREFDPGLPTLSPMEQEDSDIVSAHRTAVFAKSENGLRRIVLGNSGSGAEALSLEVELSDLR